MIHSGLFRTYYVDENGDDITLQFHKPDIVLISIDSFNKQTASKENIVALEPSELLTLNYKNMQKLFFLVPAWQQICKINRKNT